MSSEKKRVVLKLTGEIFSERKGPGKEIFHRPALEYAVGEIRSVREHAELIIVIGGGNIVRGSSLMKKCRTSQGEAHIMGMLATIMNALFLRDALEQSGIDARVMTSLECDKAAEPFIQKRALRHLQKGRIVIVAGGAGVPGMTTDGAAVFRGAELGASIVFKGTKVDAVYDVDPGQYDTAKPFRRLTYKDFNLHDLKGILDSHAVAKAEDAGIPIRVFDFFKEGNSRRAIVLEEGIGTLISSEA